MSHLAIASIVLPLAAFICSAILTACVKRRSIATGFVSRPREDRYNRNVIALGGGIAIFWTIALFILVGAGVVKFIIEPGHLNFIDASIAQHTAGFMSRINDLLIVLAAVLILHLLGL